jgi:hypothetical protein
MKAYLEMYQHGREGRDDDICVEDSSKRGRHAFYVDGEAVDCFSGGEPGSEGGEFGLVGGGEGDVVPEEWAGYAELVPFLACSGDRYAVC